jgi:hypothetical protein
VPIADYRRVCQERDELRATHSAVVAILQNPTLSWKQRVLRVGVPLVLQAQRPTDNPAAPFPVNMGDAAHRAGLIPPTAAGDEKRGRAAYDAGRKLIGQALREIADAGGFRDYHRVREYGENGEITGSRIVLSIPGAPVDLLHAANYAPGERTIQRSRGRHVTRLDPHCRACGSAQTSLECQSCGLSFSTEELLERENTELEEAEALQEILSSPTDFQPLEVGTHPVSTVPNSSSHLKSVPTAADFQPLEVGPERPPAWLQPIPENVPEELIERNQWVCWRAEWRDERWTKLPLNPRTGTNALSTKPETWGAFHEALDGMRRHGCDGVGFVFTAPDPFTCVDLDTLDAEALAIVAELDSYTEMSPSGRGAHVILEGAKPAGGCRRGTVEMYDTGRFLTITGHWVERTPPTIRERQPALEAVHARIFPPRPAAPPRPVQGVSHDDDVTVLRKMFGCRNGAEIRRLWNGDWGAYPSQSEGDAALCAHLRYWCDGDVAQVERLFPQSGLYRAKWERADYRRQTFQTAGLV